MTTKPIPRLLILNQMAGPLTWELAEDLGKAVGPLAMLTGHPDTLAKGSTETVWLSPAIPYDRGSFARRALSWLRYLWQAFWWLWHWPKDIPLLLFSNPPMLCWLGWLMRFLRGQRYFVMVHDIYPDLLVALEQIPDQHLLARIWRGLNRTAYQRAEVVMTLGDCMAATLAKQFDPSQTPGQKIEVIHPWVDTDKIKPFVKEQNRFAQTYNQIGKLTVMYSGNMGFGHDIESMIETAQRLQDEPRVQFMFIGSGPKWSLVQAAIEREHLSNVTLLPWQPEDSLAEQLATADLGFVSLEKALRGLAMPSKSLYMIAAGAPLLAIDLGPSDLQLLVEQNDCGMLIPPQHPELCEAAIRKLRSDEATLSRLKESARQAAVNRYGRRENVERFQKLLFS